MLEIIRGDALEELKKLRSESVQCCVTSPPYWGLRDYGTAEWEGGDAGCDHRNVTQGNGQRPGRTQLGEQPFKGACGKCGAKRIDSQIGLERTPEEYVGKMVEIFREVRRVLRSDGTLWLNLGDSYASDFKGSGGSSEKQLSNAGSFRNGNQRLNHGLKPKDLCGIPWRVAFALQSDGWWLRQDIIWSKPNPMPESVTDRCTKSHEYLFLLTKSARYFYDAEAIKERGTIPEGTLGAKGSAERFGMNGVNSRPPEYKLYNGQRNKRSVWTVATAPYPEAHFATYPPDLIKPCILAGTSAKGCCAKCGSPWERIVEKSGGTIGTSWHNHENDLGRGQRGGDDGNVAADAWSRGDYKVETLGWQPTCECEADIVPCTVLDPFAGSGTTGAVALELGRKAILIELNPKYVELIRQRCDITPGLALA